MPLVEQVILPELVENPPDRLDIIRLEGDICFRFVHPEAHAVGELFPLFDVLHRRSAAAAVELFNAKLFDLLFAAQPKALLDLDLNGQPVGVPAALALHIVALHDLVAREHVLKGAREDMMNARPAIRRRWSFKKDIARPIGPLTQRLLEDLLLLPHRHHPLFHLWIIHRRGDGVKLCFRCLCAHALLPFYSSIQDHNTAHPP